MRYSIIFFSILAVSFGSYSQPLNLKGGQEGLFSFGIRSTMSVFGDGNIGVNSLGYGGQFRLQLSERVNTEWFGDFTRGNIAQIANRSDYHIGWSVMYYFTDKASPPVKPYLLAGHCFDRTEITDNRNPANKIVKNSSAIQAGGGVHFNLTPRLDLSFIANYMFHLGKDVHAHVVDDEIHLETHKGTGIEGHILLNLGVNYKIADLWGKKSK